MRRGPRAVRQKQAQVDILTAAARLLSDRGYHGMSMRDLARATRMSLANLYNYFAAKEDLVFELQTRAFETLIAMAEEAVRTGEGAEARLHAFILSHVRYVATHRDAMRVLVEEAGELPPPRRRQVRTLKERYYRIGLGAVREVVEYGCGRPGAAGFVDLDETGTERATYSIFGMLNWVYAWYDPARHGSPQDVARTIHRVALCGLVARCPSRSLLSATERQVGRLQVRSPVHPSGRTEEPS